MVIGRNALAKSLIPLRKLQTAQKYRKADIAIVIPLKIGRRPRKSPIAPGVELQIHAVLHMLWDMKKNALRWGAFAKTR